MRRVGWGAILAIAVAAIGAPAGRVRFAAADPPAAAKAGAAQKPAEDDESDATDVLGSNAACYVCHTTFVKEDLAKVHLKEKIGCIKCHGPSEKHANDEHVGATKPDVVIKRHEVDASCVKCHETHDAPARAVIARFIDRKLPADAKPICTGCHGMHKVDKASMPTGAKK